MTIFLQTIVVLNALLLAAAETGLPAEEPPGDDPLPWTNRAAQLFTDKEIEWHMTIGLGYARQHFVHLDNHKHSKVIREIHEIEHSPDKTWPYDRTAFLWAFKGCSWKIREYTNGLNLLFDNRLGKAQKPFDLDKSVFQQSTKRELDKLRTLHMATRAAIFLTQTLAVDKDICKNCGLPVDHWRAFEKGSHLSEVGDDPKAPVRLNDPSFHLVGGLNMAEAFLQRYHPNDPRLQTIRSAREKYQADTRAVGVMTAIDRNQQALVWACAAYALHIRRQLERYKYADKDTDIDSISLDSISLDREAVLQPLCSIGDLTESLIYFIEKAIQLKEDGELEPHQEEQAVGGK